ncbi:hypothetical protein [Ornithobacterium rhinotracheale]|uniref:Uncharacterized protein n=1 Tax=Ornithobacterium rhinotracheale (strain ATCC 51463 / DSM 15997 / CCUG 23171 / CIP 104009 / LMG 9086) TaxID=867902 RepID=I4A1F4_ORNRL|nr:hypothetical protein [Ornithobacterium rhinotracheale]AFL97788.1 hypothetical protein Ornrh_1630 [Ornithobacterium rhinotracheale DSM 15997]
MAYNNGYSNGWGGNPNPNFNRGYDRGYNNQRQPKNILGLKLDNPRMEGFMLRLGIIQSKEV